MEHEFEEIEVEVIEMPLENGTIVKCAILDEFEIDDQAYIVLGPLVDEETIGTDVWYYRCEEDGDEMILNAIDDEVELALVQAAYLDIFEDEDEEEEE